MLEWSIRVSRGRGTTALEKTSVSAYRGVERSWQTQRSAANQALTAELLASFLVRLYNKLDLLTRLLIDSYIFDLKMLFLTRGLA
jgi:hypothetical protein